MTDATPPPRFERFRYVQGPVTTGDFLVLGIVVLVLVATFAMTLIVIVVNLDMNDSTTARWAAFGTWFAGLATASSVAAAVVYGNKQTKQSREAVEQQLRQSDWQHTVQMDELRGQLQTTIQLHGEQLSHDTSRQQLDLAYESRARQLNAIETVWTAIGRVVGPTTELKIRIERIHGLQQKVDKDATDTESVAERDRRRVQFSEWTTTYQDHIVQALIAFNSAHLWISDVEIRAQVLDLEKAFTAMSMSANFAIMESALGRKSLGDLDAKKSALLQLREPMIRLAAKKLSPSALLRGDVPDN